MKQSKALALTIIAFACTIVAFGNSQFGLAAVCLVPAFLFGCLWFSKYQRDHAIVSRATEQQALPPHQPTQPLEITQTVTSKQRTNGGLFVPPPLH
jgi:hypothetical protein